jgi:hypothetical protein
MARVTLLLVVRPHIMQGWHTDVHSFSAPHARVPLEA